MKNTSLERNSNFELLRIFAMLGIIISHISIHGLYLTKEIIPDSTMLQIIQGFFSLGPIGNCIFMLLSGYFLCTSTFKPIKILELWLQLLFYSVAIAAFIYIFNLDIFVAGNEYYNSPDYNLFVKKINKLNAILSFFPILTNKNWYISVYLGFYAFLPFFQIIDRNIDQKKHLYLLGLLFFL